MAARLHLADLRRAWDVQDPELVDLILRLAQQPDEQPAEPIRDGALTFDRFLREIRGYDFRRKTEEEQAHFRIERLKALEAPDAEVPLSDRLRLHEILLLLWNDNGTFARDCLLKVIARIPFTYGPWRALKRIFKEAEAKNDTEIYGALAARFDAAMSGHGANAVSGATLAYLCRRAWRYLRRTALTLPAAYADTACDFLAPYDDSTHWVRTWVINHIFYHETKKYGRSRFRFGYRLPEGGPLKHRAFAELWQRTPRPLFSLLERAKSDHVREFATAALKADFRALLREVEPSWVARLVNVGSAAIDSFVVWILKNVPRFEQAAFRTLGLHDAVLRLFDSPSQDARAYAAEYARTHARDLPVNELVRLADNDNAAVRKLAADLLLARDPRTEVGLDAWSKLLESRHASELAGNVIRKNFGARELTPEWFRDRFFSEADSAFEFAKKLLPQIHPPQKLGAGFFIDLLDRCNDPNSPAFYNVTEYAVEELARFDLNTLDRDFLRRMLLHPNAGHSVMEWVHEGRLKAATLGADFLKVAAFHASWDSDPWLTALRQSDKTWARELEFSEHLSTNLLEWLGDVRRFSPTDLGRDWLLSLVGRSEPTYHQFAVEYLIKAFAPADFAPSQPAATAIAAAAPAAVDLAKATFLFTGKLATMGRKEAEDKVKAANGVVAGSVTPKLYYLVIGDEGSPLYGAGNKGSKQLKAEELNAAGANIKIISETAFLQMLAGTAPAARSEDATLAGCEWLWQQVGAPGPADAPVGQFARRYILKHHPDIALAETGRPVDPGYEIPPGFLNFERVRPLFGESRQPLRAFALELAKWEFARWSPPAKALVEMCELPYPEVRQFVADALLAEDRPEHRRYRINPDVLSPAAVYSFCESPNEATRWLGMQLIDRSPRLRLPEELFRLSESPDRKVRAFVIRALWSLYRDRGITEGWVPPAPPKPTVGAGTRKAAEAAEVARGTGAPARPDKPPAGPEAMSGFLRRMLFEIPPGRDKPASEEDRGILARLRPLPARKAKLSLVDVVRDLALEDAGFARAALPVLREFMTSFGPSERDACLVAVTRIRHQHAELAPATA